MFHFLCRFVFVHSGQVCPLTQVSVGDHAPVVLAAVSLHLHPVARLSRSPTEAHGGSGVVTLTC